MRIQLAAFQCLDKGGLDFAPKSKLFHLGPNNLQPNKLSHDHEEHYNGERDTDNEAESLPQFRGERSARRRPQFLPYN